MLHVLTHGVKTGVGGSGKYHWIHTQLLQRGFSDTLHPPIIKRRSLEVALG